MNLGMRGDIADVKNAFTQSNPIRRSGGAIYVEACRGVAIEEGALVELLVNVYGLDDAPVAWRKTVIDYLFKRGCERSLLEPCWWLKYDGRGSIESTLLLDVDDFFIASASEEVRAGVRRLLEKRFKFGK